MLSANSNTLHTNCKFEKRWFDSSPPHKFKNDIFICKLYIMSKSKKEGKPKANRGNQVKRTAVIKKNEEILSRLKNQ